MSADMQCPYCNADQEVCHDDGFGYKEDERHEHRCSKCRKSFVFTTTMSFYYEAEQADCLNGSDHRLELSKTYPPRYAKMCCQTCDYQRLPTDAEFIANGIEPTDKP